MIDPALFVMPDLIITPESQVTPSLWQWSSISLYVYLTGLLISLSIFVYQLVRLVRFIQREHKNATSKYGLHLINTNGSLPTSSFFNYILWDNTQVLSKEAIGHIMKHERSHAYGNHTLDILIAELVKIVLWFNPIVWLIKKELIVTHEYIADSEAADDVKNYSKILATQALNQQGFYLPHTFKSNAVLKRLDKLKKLGKRTNRVRFGMIITLTSLVIFSMSFNIKEFGPKAESLENNIENTDSEIFTLVEESATPVGGMATFYEFISKNIDYPLSAREAGAEGRVYVQFVVNENGKITEPTVIKSSNNEACDLEALRVVSNAPDWNPGRQRGKAVNQKVVVPINFRLEH